jgi:hypothetical protein
VPYHENFWVAVAAAAPVIALASVISATDALRMYDDFERPADIAEEAWPDKLARQGIRWLWVLMTVTGLNLVVEGFALVFALISLANGYNQIPPVIPAIGVPAGIALVVISGVLTIDLKYTRRDIRDALKATLAEQPFSGPDSQSAKTTSQPADRRPSAGQPNPGAVKSPGHAAASTTSTGGRATHRHGRD